MDFGEPTKLNYAKQLAAALGFVGLCRADRVKIETLGATQQRRQDPCSAAGAASGGCSNTSTRFEPNRERLAGRGREELLPAELGQGNPRPDQRPDGQGGLRGRPALSPGAGHGRLRDPRALRRRNSIPTSRATCGWSTARTATRPKSRSAGRCWTATSRRWLRLSRRLRDYCTRRGMVYLLAEYGNARRTAGHRLSSRPGVGAIDSWVTSSTTCFTLAVAAPGTDPAGDRRALLPQTQAPAAGSAQHIPLASHRSKTCTSTASGSGCGRICCCSCSCCWSVC